MLQKHEQACFHYKLWPHLTQGHFLTITQLYVHLTSTQRLEQLYHLGMGTAA